MVYHSPSSGTRAVIAAWLTTVGVRVPSLNAPRAEECYGTASVGMEIACIVAMVLVMLQLSGSLPVFFCHAVKICWFLS